MAFRILALFVLPLYFSGCGTIWYEDTGYYKKELEICSNRGLSAKSCREEWGCDRFMSQGQCGRHMRKEWKAIEAENEESFAGDRYQGRM